MLVHSPFVCFYMSFGGCICYCGWICLVMRILLVVCWRVYCWLMLCLVFGLADFVMVLLCVYGNCCLCIDWFVGL